MVCSNDLIQRSITPEPQRFRGVFLICAWVLRCLSLLRISRLMPFSFRQIPIYQFLALWKIALLFACHYSSLCRISECSYRISPFFREDTISHGRRLLPSALLYQVSLHSMPYFRHEMYSTFRSASSVITAKIQSLFLVIILALTSMESC